MADNKNRLQKSRDELKSYFAAGKKPAVEDFAALIDSNVNIVDDDIGGRFTIVSGGAIEFKKKSFDREPLWRIGIDAENSLTIVGDGQVVKISPDKKVTFGQGVSLHLNGPVYADAFIDNGDSSAVVAADKKWYNFLDDTSDSYTYEITAMCDTKTKFGLLFIKAVVARYNKKPARICITTYGWKSFFGNIRFRWRKQGNDRVLQIRSGKNYGQNTVINLRIKKIY